MEAPPPPEASCEEIDVVNLWEQLKPQLASLMSQTLQRLASYTETLEIPRWGTAARGKLESVLKRGNSLAATESIRPG